MEDQPSGHGGHFKTIDYFLVYRLYLRCILFSGCKERFFAKGTHDQNFLTKKEVCGTV